VKGVRLVLRGLACACCGHADSSPAAACFGGSCIAQDFGVGAVLVTPRCCQAKEVSESPLQGPPGSQQQLLNHVLQP